MFLLTGNKNSSYYLLSVYSRPVLGTKDLSDAPLVVSLPLLPTGNLGARVDVASQKHNVPFKSYFLL